MRSSDGTPLQSYHIIQRVLVDGLRPEITTTCPSVISDMMNKCLHVDPSQRPTAAELVAKLVDKISWAIQSQSTGTFDVLRTFSPVHDTSTANLSFERTKSISMEDPILEYNLMPLEELQFTRLLANGSYGEV